MRVKMFCFTPIGYEEFLQLVQYFNVFAEYLQTDQQGGLGYKSFCDAGNYLLVFSLMETQIDNESRKTPKRKKIDQKGTRIFKKRGD